MGRPVGLIAPVLLSLQLAGCATSALDMAPDRPDAPWTAATAPNGEIIAGERVPSDLPRNPSYVLPPNQAMATPPPPAFELERRHPYSLPELIDIAQSSNPVTRNAWNDARNAALAAGIVESTFLPLVSAGIVQGWQQFHNENSALGTTLTNNVTAKGNIEVLSIQWLLFDFGERAALLDAAKQGSAISNIAFTAAH
jgi:outer membrane protein